MNELPFKVRKREPEIIQVDKSTALPKEVEEGRLGSTAVMYKGKIYAFSKRLPKQSIEHEKAHVQIVNSKLKSPKGIVAWLDDEVKADLLTYQRTGEPKSITNYLNSRAIDARYYHLETDIKQGYKYNLYEQNRHILGHIEEAYKRYWDYLPEQWEKDYKKWMDSMQRGLESDRRLGKNVNPPGDYQVKKFKAGGYDVHKRKVVKKRDKVTGFIVKSVEI